MTKTIDKWGKFQLSFTNEKDKLLFKEFMRLIKKDPFFNAKSEKKFHGNPGIVSKSILLIIYNYVIRRNPTFKVSTQEENEVEPEQTTNQSEEENEEPKQTTNQNEEEKEVEPVVSQSNTTQTNQNETSSN